MCARPSRSSVLAGRSRLPSALLQGLPRSARLRRPCCNPPRHLPTARSDASPSLTAAAMHRRERASAFSSHPSPWGNAAMYEELPGRSLPLLHCSERLLQWTDRKTPRAKRASVEPVQRCIVTVLCSVVVARCSIAPETRSVSPVSCSIASVRCRIASVRCSIAPMQSDVERYH